MFNNQKKSLIQFIDARHDIQKNDFAMREWVEAYNLPIFTIVTKIDYVSKNRQAGVLANIKRQFSGDVLPFSAKDKYFCEETIEYLTDLCK